MKINWFIIALLALDILGLGVSMGNHGKPRTGNYSVWTALLSTIIVFSLLYFGGVFSLIITGGN